MATSEAARSRAPRGAKAVVSAFLAALHDIPDARRVEVAKAAQIGIRDEVKTLAAKAKEAARKPAKAAPVKAKTAKPAPARKVVAKKSAAAAMPVRRTKRASAAAAAA